MPTQKRLLKKLKTVLGLIPMLYTRTDDQSEMPKQDPATQSKNDFDEFAEIVGTETPDLSRRIHIVSKSINLKSRKLKARWSIEKPHGIAVPKPLAKELWERYGRK
jgi:hypothetical protein